MNSPMPDANRSRSGAAAVVVQPLSSSSAVGETTEARSITRAPTNAAPVTPEKVASATRREQHDEEEREAPKVTADTVMGFPSLPNKTNKEIVANHHGFVRWAKEKQDENAAFGKLLGFVEWLDSPEGQQLEMEAQGSEQFTYGKHKGKRFAEIAECDPQYHERFLHILRKKGEEPDPLLSRYIAWFEKVKGPSQPAVVASRPAPCRSSFSSSGGSSVNGNERFRFGQHRGETFQQVAREDPSYHLRYAAMNPSPPPQILRYIHYFDEHGDPYAAQQGELDTLACHAGIWRPSWNMDEDEW